MLHPARNDKSESEKAECYLHHFGRGSEKRRTKIVKNTREGRSVALVPAAPDPALAPNVTSK
jgi:hypothetical protein